MPPLKKGDESLGLKNIIRHSQLEGLAPVAGCPPTSAIARTAGDSTYDLVPVIREFRLLGQGTYPAVGAL
jgi:hypothetical protein